MLIEVFKTDIADEWKATEIKHLLLRHFPSAKINVDLDDCDKVLRMEGVEFTTAQVILLVKKKGVVCSVID